MRLPARGEEIHHAEEEGVEFLLLTNPLRFLGDDEGRLTGVECLRQELGEPDASGRRRPVPIPGSEFTVEIDTAVIAIGSGSNPLLTKSTPGLALNKWGYIVADPKTGKTMKQRRLGRRRHRHRLRHRHPGHGRRPPGRQLHPRLSDHGVVRRKTLGEGEGPQALTPSPKPPSPIPILFRGDRWVAPFYYALVAPASGRRKSWPYSSSFPSGPIASGGSSRK